MAWLHTLKVVSPVRGERLGGRDVGGRRRTVRVRDGREREQRVGAQLERDAAVDERHAAGVREELAAAAAPPLAESCCWIRRGVGFAVQVERGAPDVQLSQRVLCTRDERNVS